MEFIYLLPFIIELGCLYPFLSLLLLFYLVRDIISIIFLRLRISRTPDRFVFEFEYLPFRWL